MCITHDIYYVFHILTYLRHVIILVQCVLIIDSQHGNVLYQI